MANLSELLKQVESHNLNEKCKKHGKGSKKKLMETSEIKDNTIEMLHTIAEMVEQDALTASEQEILTESIETIFNNILNESDDEDYDDYDYEDESDEDYEDEDESDEDEDSEVATFKCNDDNEQGCDWSGTEDDLVEDEDGEFTCPECGSSVTEDDSDEEDYEDESDDEEDSDEDYEDESDDEEDYEDEDELTEAKMLKKSSAKAKKAARRRSKSAEGKKSAKIFAKKRSKFKTKISRCAEKGQTFSIRKMKCVKPSKQR